MVKVGEYRDCVPVEGATQIINSALIFRDPSESTSWCERHPREFEHARNDDVPHR